MKDLGQDSGGKKNQAARPAGLGDTAPLHQGMGKTGSLIHAKEERAARRRPVDGARTLPLCNLNPCVVHGAGGGRGEADPDV